MRLVRFTYRICYFIMVGNTKNPWPISDDELYVVLFLWRKISQRKSEKNQGGSARRNADKSSANERSHVNVITIGAKELYGRRKRSNLNPSTSVRCEGIGKKFFFAFFWREWNLSCDTFFFFAPHFGKIRVLLSEVIFFMYFFLLFWYLFMYFL